MDPRYNNEKYWISQKFLLIFLKMFVSGIL